MAIHDNRRPLETIFPGWSIDRRMLIWLWLVLRAEGMRHNFDAPDIPYAMADHIRGNGLIDAIADRKAGTLIPEHELKWITQSERQVHWFWHSYAHLFNEKNMRLPEGLTPRESLIAVIDYSDEAVQRKRPALSNIKDAWVKKQTEDRHFAWYVTTGKERLKCEIAWSWYQDHHTALARRTIKFSKQDDVLAFLDATDFSLDEKRFHLSEIKKKFKAEETRANREGTKQTNLSLSAQARAQLDYVAKNERLTKTQAVELLVEHAYKHGIPR